MGRAQWAMSQASLMGFRRLRGGAAQGLVRPPVTGGHLDKIPAASGFWDNLATARLTAS
jgi:hypothetical protein